jgi:hypothetical protein
VPVGGATGQVLAKTSASNYATDWVQPGGAVPPPVVGESLMPDFRGTLTATALNNNQMQAVAMFVPRSVTVDEIGIVVTTSAAAPAEGRLGIYDSDSDGNPDNLIVDAGLYDATTTGNKIITLSPAVTLPQGIVFLVNCRQSTGSFQVRRYAFGSAPRRPETMAGALSNVPHDWGRRQNDVSGAFPATWTSSTVEQGGLLMAVNIASIV